MANDPEWQRRSDGWVKMLDQSRSHKEKRRADHKKMSYLQIKESAEFRLNKSVHNLSVEQNKYEQDRQRADD